MSVCGANHLSMIGHPERDDWPVIAEAARALEVHLSQGQAEALASFVQLVSIWNRRFRLIGTRDRGSLIGKHILDCLVPARVLGTVTGVVDIGTGAGLPGIPLAIVCAHLSVTLVDSRRTRANFVREVVRVLQLKNVRVVEGRIQCLIDDPGTRRSFDATIARAWAKLPEFLQISAGLLRGGGIAVSMKGPKALAEAAALGGVTGEFSSPSVVDYCLPNRLGRRTLLVFSRL